MFLKRVWAPKDLPRALQVMRFAMTDKKRKVPTTSRRYGAELPRRRNKNSEHIQEVLQTVQACQGFVLLLLNLPLLSISYTNFADTWAGKAVLNKVRRHHTFCFRS
jgi:hypothetical protein